MITYMITAGSNPASSDFHQTSVGLLKNYKPLTSRDRPACPSSVSGLGAHWSPGRASVLQSETPSQQMICCKGHWDLLVLPLIREELSLEMGLIGVVVSVNCQLDGTACEGLPRLWACMYRAVT